jgi:tetratricopeptide (TPR) repeat protein
VDFGHEAGEARPAAFSAILRKNRRQMELLDETSGSMKVVSKLTTRIIQIRVQFFIGCMGILCVSCGAPQTGHEQMVALLAEIAEKAIDGDDEFFGRAVPLALEAELDDLDANSAVGRRLQLNFQLGWHYLRLGEVDDAVEHYLAADRLLSQVRHRVPAEQVSQLAYDLGVAYMRMGEIQNCAVMHNADRCLMPIREGGVHQLREGSRNAVRYFTQVLEEPTTQPRMKLKARWLLNIAYMTLGEYPDGVPEAYRIEPAVFDSDEAFPRFTEIAPQLGLDEMSLAGGAIAEDFDGDGNLDIMVSAWSPMMQLRYFHNDGDGTFSDRSAQAGLEGLLGGLNLKQADYDNDGDADVVVMRGAWLDKDGQHPNSLIRNNGDGTFTDVTFEAGLGHVHYPTQTAGWADYDNDGSLDLYIGNESNQRLKAPSQLFRNNGNGTFTDVAAHAGVENDLYAKGVTWGDYDGDRFPDLYVSNMGGANRLYHNNRDGTFTDVAKKLGVAGPSMSFPAWFWDFDNDGVLDLYVTTYSVQDIAAVAGSYLGMTLGGELNRLYRGDGKGGFEDVTAEQNLGRLTVVMGSNFGDLDNDGFPDFYLGTGYPYYDALMPNVMYRNRGGHGFADVTTNGGFGHLQKGHGVAFADLDNDGDQDVFEEMGGAFPGDAFGNALFENPGFDNHWIKLALVGVESNRAAIGARIRIEITEEGKARSIFTHVDTGGSFGSNPLRREIGLGRASKIDVLEIFWPTTGKTQRFEDVDAGQLIEITEGQERYRRLPLEPISFQRTTGNARG